MVEREKAWPNIKRPGRTCPKGPKYTGWGTWLPRHESLVILYAGMFWPRYKAGEGKAEVGRTLAGGQRCCHVTTITGEAYLYPCPAFLTMTIGQRGYRVYQPGMEVHIASNQGATRGYGLSLVGPQDGHTLSLPSHVFLTVVKQGQYISLAPASRAGDRSFSTFFLHSAPESFFLLEVER